MNDDSMYRAARRGDFEAVRRFAQHHPESVNEHDPDWGSTPLHWAAKAHNLALAEFLIDAGADVDAVDSTNRTPLQWVLQADTSAYQNARPMIQLLLSRSATPNFETTLRRGTRDQVAACINNGTPINGKLDDGSSPLALAAREGAPEVVQLLLDSGAAPDGESFDKTTPLSAAIDANRPDVAALLLQAGADPERDVDGRQLPMDAVVHCAEIRNDAIIEFGDLLLAHGARVTPQLAAALDSVEFLDQALQTGWDINRRGHYGCTALWVATKLKQPRIARVLLERGADPDIADDSGYTPLHVVAEPPFMMPTELLTELAQLLIAGKADVNAIDYRGRTPLHSALKNLRSMGVNLDVVRMLVAAGADPQARDDEGITPFDADREGHMDLHGHTEAQMEEAVQRMRATVAKVKEILRLA